MSGVAALRLERLALAERNLSRARWAGFGLPPGDTGRLAVTDDLPDGRELTGDGPYLVVHASASVPARAPSAAKTAACRSRRMSQSYATS